MQRCGHRPASGPRRENARAQKQPTTHLNAAPCMRSQPSFVQSLRGIESSSILAPDVEGQALRMLRMFVWSAGQVGPERSFWTAGQVGPERSFCWRPERSFLDCTRRGTQFSPLAMARDEKTSQTSQGDVSDDDFLDFVQQTSAGAVAEAVQDATAELPSTVASPDASAPVSRSPSATGAPAEAASPPNDATPNMPFVRLFRVVRKYPSVPDFMSDGPRFLSSRRYGHAIQPLAENSSPAGDLAVARRRPSPRKRTGDRTFPSSPEFQSGGRFRSVGRFGSLCGGEDTAADCTASTKQTARIQLYTKRDECDGEEQDFDVARYHSSSKQAFEATEDVRLSSPASVHQSLEEAPVMCAQQSQTDEIPHGHDAGFLTEHAEPARSAAAPSVDEKVLLKALDWNRMQSETQKMQRENDEIRRSLQQDREQVTQMAEENARLRSDMEKLSRDNDILRDTIQGQSDLPKQDLPQAFHSDQVLQLRHENTNLHEEISRLQAALQKPHTEGQKRGLSMDGASNREACITLVLGTDFQKAGAEGTEERKTFEAILVQDLSDAAGIPKESFHVRGIRSGSIVVEVGIKKSRTDARSPIAVARDLERQAYAPASKLCAGTLTRHIDVIMVSLGEDEDFDIQLKKDLNTAGQSPVREEVKDSTLNSHKGSSETGILRQVEDLQTILANERERREEEVARERGAIAAERSEMENERCSSQEERDRMAAEIVRLNVETQALKAHAAEAGLAAMQGQQKLDEMENNLRDARSRQGDYSLIVSRLTSEIQTLQSALGEKAQELKEIKADLVQSNNALQQRVDMSAAIMGERIDTKEMLVEMKALEDENKALSDLVMASAAAQQQTQAKFGQEREEIQATLDRERAEFSTSLANLGAIKDAAVARVRDLQAALDNTTRDVAKARLEIEAKDADLDLAKHLLMVVL